ncbi:hypothetical protein JZ751_005970 [Albula glossodonta]|uniref:RING-type domain-containing protein n=1 Tax=Albula glossodonta TaxID=121402 RepID=A0A8T2P0Y4_9TELE|nr:hypothetical protein JZ751_005970 [Albula glossodonta]
MGAAVFILTLGGQGSTGLSFLKFIYTNTTTETESSRFTPSPEIPQPALMTISEMLGSPPPRPKDRHALRGPRLRITMPVSAVIFPRLRGECDGPDMPLLSVVSDDAPGRGFFRVAVQRAETEEGWKQSGGTFLKKLWQFLDPVVCRATPSPHVSINAGALALCSVWWHRFRCKYCFNPISQLTLQREWVRGAEISGSKSQDVSKLLGFSQPPQPSLWHSWNMETRLCDFHRANVVQSAICAVCLEEFKQKDELGICPCKHAFHRKPQSWYLQWTAACPLPPEPLKQACVREGGVKEEEEEGEESALRKHGLQCMGQPVPRCLIKWLEVRKVCPLCNMPVLQLAQQQGTTEPQGLIPQPLPGMDNPV